MHIKSLYVVGFQYESAQVPYPEDRSNMHFKLNLEEAEAVSNVLLTFRYA